MDLPAPGAAAAHMRQRPGMYIGGLNSRAIRNLIDEAITGLLSISGRETNYVHCKLDQDGTTCIQVNGLDIGVVEPEAFLPGQCDVLSPLYSLAMSSAFSERLDAEVVRDGQRWSQSFSAGLPVNAVARSPSTAPPGVRFRCRLDASLFKPDMKVGYLALCGRAREWAAFHQGVRFTIEDEESRQLRDYQYPKGLISLVEELEHNHCANGGTSLWHCSTSDGTDSAEAVVIRRSRGSAAIHSFVNGQSTSDEGTHVKGLASGMGAVIASYPARSAPFYSPRRRPRDPLACLTVYISMQLKNPEWRTATRDVVGNERAHNLVRDMIVSQLPAEIERTRSK